MKNVFRAALIAIPLFVLNGCYYDHVPELPPPVEKVSFQNDIQPIFTKSCIACHNGSLTPDLRDGNSYDALIGNNLVIAGDADNSELAKRINGTGNLMPPGNPLTNTEIQLIEEWINDGANDN